MSTIDIALNTYNWASDAQNVQKLMAEGLTEEAALSEIAWEAFKLIWGAGHFVVPEECEGRLRQAWTAWCEEHGAPNCLG